MTQFQQITSIKDERAAEARELPVLAGFSAPEKQQLIDYLKRIQANCAAFLQEV